MDGKKYQQPTISGFTGPVPTHRFVFSHRADFYRYFVYRYFVCTSRLHNSFRAIVKLLVVKLSFITSSLVRLAVKVLTGGIERSCMLLPRDWLMNIGKLRLIW